MNNFATVFAIYAPIYIYAFCGLYAILLIGLATPKNTVPSINNFHKANRTALPRVLFILTLAALLGTPPTIGFFAKILTFYVLVQASNILLFVAVFLTLILLIFYLQVIRTRSILRKKSNNIHQNLKSNALFLIYGQYFLILFTLSVPFILDIMYCFYM